MGRVTHYDTVQMLTWLAAQKENVAKYYVTVAAGDTHTINSLGVSAATTIDWGDGLSNEYTGTSTRTHQYASAGTYEVKIMQPDNVSVFDLRDAKTSVLNSADLKSMVNIGTFNLINLTNATGTINSADLVDWRPSSFYLQSLTNLTITLNSADMVDWRPSGTFNLYNLPNATININSADLVDWRPSTFNLYNLPNATGTINTADLVDWRPSTIYLHTLPNITGTIDTADLVDWRPSGTFYLNNLPNATININSADLVDWRPSTFTLQNLPNATININSADLVDWRPVNFYLNNLPNATITISPNTVKNWSPIATLDFRTGNLTQQQCDLILWEAYQIERTRTGGTINLSITGNAAPSGTFQSATSCPVTAATPGKEIVHELLNNGCSKSPFNVWATVSTN